jgi:hypothetical protein
MEAFYYNARARYSWTISGKPPPNSGSDWQGSFFREPSNVIPYYSELVSMINSGHEWPNIKEHPQIA